jgi:hypothetical protein
MKKLKFSVIAIAMVVFLGSCEKKGGIRPFDEENQFKNVQKSVLVDLADWNADAGCNLLTFDLIGGQSKLMGSVTVKTIGGAILVKYEVEEGCMIKETHLFVGNDISEMPVGNSGNPKIGQFPYSWEGDGTDVVIHEVPLDGLNTCFAIAAHAVVWCPDGEETAWGKGPDSPVFAIKALVDISEIYTWYVITGVDELPYQGQENWCANFTYFPVMENIGETLPLKRYNRGDDRASVTLEKVDDFVKFTIRSYYGKVYRSELYAGSLEGLQAIGICNHTSFPYITNTTADTHEYLFPCSFFDNELTFEGQRWGWYFTYCPGPCK